jgi:hypothetical protein
MDRKEYQREYHRRRYQSDPEYRARALHRQALRRASMTAEERAARRARERERLQVLPPEKIAAILDELVQLREEVKRLQAELAQGPRIYAARVLDKLRAVIAAEETAWLD